MRLRVVSARSDAARKPRAASERPLAGGAAHTLARLALGFWVAFSGCESGSEPIQPPPADTTDGGGTVQRGALTVTLTVSGEAAQVASALGAGGSGLPGVEVTIQRVGSAEQFRQVTDSTGQVRFEGLLSGHYDVALVRLLTEAEVRSVSQALGPDFADVNAFGGGGFAEVESPSSQASFDAVAGRRGSLVISEMYQHASLGTATQYMFGRYLELYNNADTTVYLDGMLLVQGIVLLSENPERPCSVMEQWHLDEDGIWSQWHVQFPGSGSTYPVRPGEAAVVATDAIDHRSFGSDLYDLSGADFEGFGSQDVDNPRVPNLIDVGVLRWEFAGIGHGWYPGSAGITVLVQPVDTAGLPTEDFPGFRYPRHRRIPASAIVDLATFLEVPEANLFAPYCNNLVPPAFDRRPARVLNQQLTTSIARKPLATLPDGRVILQRTRTSASDFTRSAPSPGRVQ